MLQKLLRYSSLAAMAALPVTVLAYGFGVIPDDFRNVGAAMQACIVGVICYALSCE